MPQDAVLVNPTRPPLPDAFAAAPETTPELEIKEEPFALELEQAPAETFVQPEPVVAAAAPVAQQPSPPAEPPTAELPFIDLGTLDAEKRSAEAASLPEPLPPPLRKPGAHGDSVGTTDTSAGQAAAPSHGAARHAPTPVPTPAPRGTVTAARSRADRPHHRHILNQGPGDSIEPSPVAPARRSRAAFVLVPLLAVAAAAAFLVPSIRERLVGGPGSDGGDTGGAASATATENQTAQLPPAPPRPGDTEAPADARVAPPDAPPAVSDAAAALALVNALVERGELDEAAATADAAAKRLAGRLADSPDAAALAAAAAKARSASARRAMEERFEKDLAEIESLRAAEKLPDALACANDALGRVVADEARTLKLHITVRNIQSEIDRRAAEKREAERRAAMDEQLAAAHAAIDEHRHDDAIAALERAQSLGADVGTLVAEARFARLVAEAEGVAVSERARAISLFREALAIRADNAVTARVESLERAVRLERRLREVNAAIETGRAADARRSLGGFMGEATGEDLATGKECELRLVALERAIHLLQQAVGESSKGRWPAALRIANDALGVDPGNRAAAEFVSRAKLAIARPPATQTNTIGMDLVLVPAGTTAMGYARGEGDERPVHDVALDAVYVGRTEVTNSQYEQFRPEYRDRRNPKFNGDEHPVSGITWEDAVAFCAWLTKTEGAVYRLPTEAEWERSARGDGPALYPWGDAAPLDKRTARANHAAGARGAWRRDGHEFAAPVGSFAEWRSPCGALDVLGNVAEWCADWYGESYYASSPRENPRGPETGVDRVVRGGSFETPTAGLRATARARLHPQKARADVGFRVARVLFPE